MCKYCYQSYLSVFPCHRQYQTCQLIRSTKHAIHVLNHVYIVVVQFQTSELALVLLLIILDIQVQIVKVIAENPSLSPIEKRQVYCSSIRHYYPMEFQAQSGQVKRFIYNDLISLHPKSEDLSERLEDEASYKYARVSDRVYKVNLPPRMQLIWLENTHQFALHFQANALHIALGLYLG